MVELISFNQENVLKKGGVNQRQLTLSGKLHICLDSLNKKSTPGTSQEFVLFCTFVVCLFGPKTRHNEVGVVNSTHQVEPTTRFLAQPVDN